MTGFSNWYATDLLRSNELASSVSLNGRYVYTSLFIIIIIIIIIISALLEPRQMSCFSIPAHIYSQGKSSVVGAFLNETLIPALVAIVKCSTLTFVRGTLLKQLEGAVLSANGQRMKYAKHNHKLIRTNKCETQFPQLLLQYCSVLYHRIFSN